MDSKETHQQQQQQNRNAAALAGPTSTSQAMHNRSSVGALSPRQPQPQQARMLDGSPYSAATQQPWMQLGNEQRVRGGGASGPPDVIDGGDSDGGANADPPAKRKGRPPGCRDKQPRKARGRGRPFTAHVININAGEDIARKLTAYMNQEPRNACILSASGTASSVALLTNNPIRLVTYEGLYYIIDLSGTFINTESYDGATVTRTGNLSVSLAGPDAKVMGGRFGGMLVAASQVQVVVGVFGPEGVKLSAASAPANALNSSGGGGPGLAQSQGPQCLGESSEENASKSLGNSTPQPPHHRHLWPGNNPQ